MSQIQIVETATGERNAYFGIPFMDSPNVSSYGGSLPEEGILYLGVYENGRWEEEDYFYDCIDNSYAYLHNSGGVVGLARYASGTHLIGYTLVTYEEWRERTTRREYANMTYSQFRMDLIRLWERAEMEPPSETHPVAMEL